MATYQQVLAQIKAALSLRPANTKVAVAMHEAAEIAILDYTEQAIQNFTEKYNSPFNGTANTILSKAIKDFMVREREVGTFFYIAFIQCGDFDGTDYLYEILIMKAGDFSDPQTSEEAFTWSARERNPLTGPVRCILSESDGSGRYGEMVVDFSALTLGTTYECQSYTEGSLYAATLISDMGSTGGGGSFLRRESFEAEDGQTVFTFTKSPLTADAMIVVNNAIQDSGYEISGNTIIFSVGLNEGDRIIIFN